MIKQRSSCVWKIPLEKFKQIVKNSFNWKEVINACYSKPYRNSTTVKERVKKENIDTSHFKKIKTSRVWDIPTEKFKQIVKDNYSWNGVVKACQFGHSGNSSTVKERVKEENIDVSHFRGKNWSKGLKVKGNYRKTLNDLLVNNPNYKPVNQELKKRLIKEKLIEDICFQCKIKPIWDNKPLVLQLDHINGNNHDNRIDNLRILCPNCHSQTDTFCGKTKFKKKVNYKKKHKKILNIVLKQLLKKFNMCTDCNVRYFNYFDF